MFKDREKLYQVYHTILTMALTWALTLAINQYFVFRVPVILNAIFSFITAFLVYLFDLNRKNVISYLLMGSLFPILLLVFWIKKINPVNWLNNLIGWCTIYNGSEELYSSQHAKFLLFMIALLGAVSFFLITKKLAGKIIFAAILTAIMILLSIREVVLNKAVVGISFFYILTIIVEICGIIDRKKAGKQEKREGILYLAPICLLLAILAISLPSKPEPIQWKGIKHVYHNVIEQIEDWKIDLQYYFGKVESEFAVNLTGYSEDNGELSSTSDLLQDNKVALKVSASQRSKPIYLIGSVSNVYTGHSWEKSRGDYIEGELEYLLDYSELVYALARQTPDVLQSNRFIERFALTVEYNRIRTKTFFHPMKMSSYHINSRYGKLSAEPVNLLFEKVRGRGTTYENVSYEMNLQGEAFQQMLREADDFSYDTPGSINPDSMKILQTNLLLHDNADPFASRRDFYEILGDRAEMIQEQYTGLPDTLPVRVTKLAEDLTKEYETTYDKLKAIEGYLHNYKYNLRAQKLPGGWDFTDYFLFESKEGYCSAYATAMAVLGRCIGVPTRYVEGFIIKFQNIDEYNMFPVKNSQAHAWAEAYIEGIGWVPFEATAPYYASRYTIWAEPDNPGSNLLQGNPNPNEEYMHQGLGPIEPNLDVLNKKGASKSKEFMGGILVFLAAIIILFVLFIIYYNILKYRYKKTFHKANYNRKTYMLFLRILQLLRREGFTLKQQETIRMLSKRVNDRFCYNHITFTEVANIFMQYRYAEAEVTKLEFEQVEVYHQGLSRKQKGEGNKIILWLEEFIFLAKKSNR
jgi:hypothetical protein